MKLLRPRCCLPLMVSAVMIFMIGISSQSTEVNILNSSRNAIDRALDYLGVAESIKNKIMEKDPSLIAKLTDFENPGIPFLYDSVKNKQVWELKFDSLDLGCTNPGNTNPINTRSFFSKGINITMYLDPVKGTLYEIYAVALNREESTAPESYPEPDCKSATESLSSHGISYHAFPEGISRTPFLKALDAARHCEPCEAKEIIAHYVMYSDHLRSNIAAWCITCRSIFPKEFTGNSYRISPRLRNRFRCAVEDSTGACLSIDNAPNVNAGDENK